MTTLDRVPSTRRFATYALAALVSLASVAVEARPGGGSGAGSRGSRTYSAPAPTATAPSMAQPIQRSATQPGPSAPMAGAAAAPSRPRFGMGTGFMAGLLGAGLLGALMGHGFFGGLGGLTSMLGFLLQVGLVVGLVMLALRFFRRRSEPALAGAGAPYARQGLDPRTDPRVNAAPAGGSAARPRQRDEVGVTPADFDAFERGLQSVQAAFGAEDVAALRRLATPEMAGYFADEIAQNQARGVVNRISDVTLRQGDLSEAWREGPVDYATLAMRFGLRDETLERASGRVVKTGEPEALELWTFRREAGGAWILSAIQQGR